MALMVFVAALSVPASTAEEASKIKENRQKFLCEPQASQVADKCSCQGDSRFSKGAIVYTANGRMRCDRGGLGDRLTWRPVVPSDDGVAK